MPVALRVLSPRKNLEVAAGSETSTLPADEGTETEVQSELDRDETNRSNADPAAFSPTYISIPRRGDCRSG